MKTLIIQGSARSNANTKKVCLELQKHLNCDLFDLKDKNIKHFDYEYKNQLFI
jgi:flavodoxin